MNFRQKKTKNLANCNNQPWVYFRQVFNRFFFDILEKFRFFDGTRKKFRFFGKKFKNIPTD